MLLLAGEIHFEALEERHWPQVREIYLEGIATGLATFETEAPDWESWRATHLTNCSLVAIERDQVVGWAALSPVSSRCTYSGVAEVSVYVSRRKRGLGIGTSLLKELIRASEREGIWTLEAGIFPENKGSLQIHFKNGFRTVGRRERLGKLNGTWRDVLLLERRSDRIE